MMVNWVKLDRQRLVNKSIMMYKIVNNMVPEYLGSHFVLRSDTLTYKLRPSLYVALQSNLIQTNLIQAIKFDDSATSKTN